MIIKSRILCWFFITAVQITLYSSGLHAQGENYRDSSSTNSLVRGSWAFQFQIDNNFTLKAFQGAVISAKRHFSQSGAIRLGANLSLDAFDDDQSANSLIADTLFDSQNGTATSSSQTAQLTMQYLYYPNPHDAVNIFLGGGPLLQFTQTHTGINQVTSNPNSVTYTNQSDSDSKSWAIGVSGLAGVEWFASKNLSFHAEYGLSIQYISTNRTSSNNVRTDSPGIPPFFRKTNGETSRKGWAFSGSSVKFGLSVYF